MTVDINFRLNFFQFSTAQNIRSIGMEKMAPRVKVNVVEIIDAINASNSKFLYLDFILKHRARKANEHAK
ncbi:hypothetical protein VAE151_500008 [Vibrio aestuarianus]|nr:hypothetical protein VAE032_220008 [Vibrio aestuarianus]CAH8182284.1 hypothetical protein VAE055_320008 [Vibrio aestuarianus]CAH8182354.1 hypothetical protein VAE128_420008 [Vibrio aestuarianus]CAH8182422.1 hypothetical protein VAE130_530008 [Vibrio aestuarianus]CAH8182513.1 hypothetical protein VAE115_270008 [Vibrio aestuarianus]